ncbi:MAG: lysine--tRNA ligase [Candidatus Heimdallarchaeota archaeon]
MSTEFSVHWLEETIEKIVNRNPKIITLATGKTPSGHIHIGILREIIICDALKRILENKGKSVRFYLFLDDFDAAKRFPPYIDGDFQSRHLGKPFALVPCPFEGCNCESYAKHFGNELILTFKDFGIKNEIIWTYDLYNTKKMQTKIKIALENTEKIKKILKKYIYPTLDDSRKQLFIKTQKNWMPAMALCEKCDKIQSKSSDGTIKPNRVTDYLRDDEKVLYECPACGYKGEISIYSGRLKLNWRVDWPAKWAIYQTTCEPAGKDHSVKGGAYDTGLEICQTVFDYIGPIKLPYEWLRLGDQDMKTSKGIVFTPKDYLKIADPEIYRMLILRTNPMKHISLRLEEIPQYYDYYDRIENVYFGGDVESNEEADFYKYLYPLIQINETPKVKPIRIPYRLLIFLSQIQNILSVDKLYEKAKSIVKNDHFEKIITKEKFQNLLRRTFNWVKEVENIIEKELNEKIRRAILNKITIFSIPESINKKILEKVSDSQLKGILKLRKYLLENDNALEEDIQNKIFTIAKEEIKIPPKKMFEAIYQVILGKKFGPRLGPFLVLLDREWLLDRLNFE